MHTGYLVCTIYICKILSAVTFSLVTCIWLKSLKLDQKTVIVQAFLPFSLGNLLFLLPPLVFNGVITVHQSSRVPRDVYNSDPQKLDHCKSPHWSLVACKSTRDHSDHGSYFCFVRSALGRKNWAKGMQTLMVLFEWNTPNCHQILNTVKIIRKDGLSTRWRWWQAHLSWR